MIRIYEVYIDIYFIENVLMDAQILILVLLLLKEKIVLWRLFAASLAGGAGAVLILISGMGFNITYVIMVLLLDAGMLLICTYQPAKRQKACRITFQKLAKGIIYLHGMVFAYGKLIECAGRLAGGRPTRIIVTVIITGIVVFLSVYRNFADQRHIYEVTLTENGEDVAIRALFDTGNLLTDPVSGKPVSIIEETEEIKRWMTEYPQKYKIIPYQSIGKEHGVLEGIVVDELMIQKEKEQVVKKETIVALYKGKLSKDGAFQMILNHSLISM